MDAVIIETECLDPMTCFTFLRTRSTQLLFLHLGSSQSPEVTLKHREDGSLPSGSHTEQPVPVSRVLVFPTTIESRVIKASIKGANLASACTWGMVPPRAPVAGLQSSFHRRGKFCGVGSCCWVSMATVFLINAQ